jgi:hypothetical protein
MSGWCFAVLPGLAAVPSWHAGEERPKSPSKTPGLDLVRNEQWFWLLLRSSPFHPGNSSDAFLMLRAQTVGFSLLNFSGRHAFSLVVALHRQRGTLRYFRQTWVNNAGWLIYAVIYLGFVRRPLAYDLDAGYGLYYGAFWERPAR